MVRNLSRKYYLPYANARCKIKGKKIFQFVNASLDTTSHRIKVNNQ